MSALQIFNLIGALFGFAAFGMALLRVIRDRKGRS